MKKYIIYLILILAVGSFIFVVKNNQERTVQLIAHRGANNIAPEHTITAYKKAIELGADFIEIDLRMTKDGYLVSMHDDTIERTTNGKGKVSNFNLDELKKLDAGSWFENRYKKETIPTLEEIFETFGKKTNYYIETRLVNNEPIMEEKLVKLIEEEGLQDQVVIESFSPDSLKAIHRIDKEIPLIQLIYPDKMLEVDEKEIKNYAIGVGPYAPKVDREFVERMHKAGLEVDVWFDRKNEKEYMKKILSYDVDTVFTDYLENTEEILSREESE
ncbi:glycerophosphodiester phosphodiesterase family protein [Lysinibacillus halotolerans]|uniref:Glycerophosphodiester phosphodiesterase n=2 Tax=Bacillales TaxID=1385 RepID=A0A3M8H8D5_9BACI|nr:MULTISPECIES: glycerophosphodiester phosphodiesterase family protein [Bacillales]MBD8028342.1 glycerophosphodiester phosphodiesterase [Ureibacillus galli]RNC98695.1 glycerophosphodiester phosphodiesterase [Lysinibacillus halotolerans]